MTDSTSPIFPHCRRAALPALIIALALLPTGCKGEQQASKTPPPQPAPTETQQPVAPPPPPPTIPVQQPVPPPAAPTPLTSVESLVAPIALYPDPLLAELLVASTYPLEVVQAARWLETKPDLATLSSKDWDASVMRLTSVPLVIKMMNDHLDWTTQLGDTFLSKPIEVMDTIQALRKRAKDAGFLKDSPEMKVTAQTVATESGTQEKNNQVQPAVLKKEVISIAPAKSDTLYVPQYNPETVYQAPLAAPPASYPGTTVVNVNTGSPAPSYYPTYYPTTTTTTTTTTADNSWANFATGALVGGLLTWGIMEWAHHDDDYYHVNHYYGNSVCHNGNCWHGGGGYYGGGYYGGGNVNSNNNINISGNEINIDRGGNFNQNNLRPSQRPSSWQPDAQHRRGQAFPAGVQQRLRPNQQPALAGQRPGAAQTLPASTRGFAENGARASAGNVAAGNRPSSADIRQQLAQKPGATASLREQNKPMARDLQNQAAAGRANGLQGMNNEGQRSSLESKRGAKSRQSSAQALDANPNRPSSGGDFAGSKLGKSPRSELNQSPRPQTRPEFNNSSQRQAFSNPERNQQPMSMPRRNETSRPNAFESSNTRNTQSFSQRGAFSRSASADTGSFRSSGSGGNFRSGGGGGGSGRRR